MLTGSPDPKSRKPGGAAALNCPRERYPRLFREAAQLKTVAPTVRVVRSQPLHSEIQIYSLCSGWCCRPTVPVVTDTPHLSRRNSASARGGVPGEWCSNRPASASMAASIPIRQCRFFRLYPRFALCVKTNKMRTNVFTSNYKNSVFFGESGGVAEKAASLSAQNPRCQPVTRSIFGLFRAAGCHRVVRLNYFNLKPHSICFLFKYFYLYPDFIIKVNAK